MMSINNLPISNYSCRNREIGLNGQLNKSQIIDARIKTLESSWRYSIPLRARKNAGTSAMDFDNAESRFLLCGSLRGDVSIVDFESFTNNNSTNETYPLNLSIIPTPKSTNHSFMVNGCQWYPVDTTVFLTTGMDKYLKIWDATRLIPIDEYNFVQPITQFHWFVSKANASSLISLTNDSSNVSFLDPRTGSTMQQIRCHKQRIWSVRWHRSKDYILITGSDQGLITFWDVRSGKNELITVQSPGEIGQTDSLKLTNNRKRAQHSSPPKNTTHANSNRINCLRCTDNGLFLVSLSQNRYICLWDSTTLKRLFCFKVPELSSDLNRISLKFELCDEGRSIWAFIPCANNISIIQIPLCVSSNAKQSGFPSCVYTGILRGHYQNIVSLIYRKTHQQLVSSSVDRLSLIWSPKMDECHLDTTAENIHQLHKDAFSDEDD